MLRHLGVLATSASSRPIVHIGLPTLRAPGAPRPGWSHYTPGYQANLAGLDRHRDLHTSYECHRATARSVQTPDQDPASAALGRSRGDDVLVAARIRPDHHAQSRRLAEPRRAPRRNAS